MYRYIYWLCTHSTCMCCKCTRRHKHSQQPTWAAYLSFAFLILQLGHKSFPLSASAIRSMPQEQRAAGPTLEGPGADVEAGVCRALGQLSTAAGVERETPKPYQVCVSVGREEIWERFTVQWKVWLEFTTKQQWDPQCVWKTTRLRLNTFLCKHVEQLAVDSFLNIGFRKQWGDRIRIQ